MTTRDVVRVGASAAMLVGGVVLLVLWLARPAEGGACRM